MFGLICMFSVALVTQPPAPDAFPERHLETIEEGLPNRQTQFDQIGAYADRLLAEGPERRTTFFAPDYSSVEAYRESVAPLREQLSVRLGYPPRGEKLGTTARYELVGEDGYSTIYRMWLEVLEGVEMYSILWVPKGVSGPAPLLITQHGGGGNPELVGAFQGTAEQGTSNYGWMVQRGLEAGFVCWAPALLFPYRGEEGITGRPRSQLDRDLKHVGTSIMAVEIYKIRRGLDEVLKRPEVDPERVGMMGLSYGGQYTLYLAAMEERIDAAVSSCYFNRREDYAWQDWTFFNIFNEFTDAELAGLVCPRRLMIEVGETDTLFAIEGAKAVAPAAAAHWENLGIEERFKFEVHAGGHEFWGEGAYEFVKAAWEGE